MIEHTDRHGQPARTWNVEELAAANALRAPSATRQPAGPRVIRRIPTEREQCNIAWRSTDRWKKEVIRELARLGSSGATIGEEGRVYVSGVGRAGMTLVLRADVTADGITIRRVILGRESWTARQAALWLRKRAAR